MIQPNELRIGNKIYGVSERAETIVLIKEDGLVHSYPGSFIEAVAGQELKDCSPIPIAEEILLKCGFERYSNELTTKLGHRYFLCRCSLTGDMFTENTDVDDSKVWHLHIQHLHQLQNIYFSLTGEELKIEL